MNSEGSKFSYSHRDIERKWQIFWKDHSTFTTNLWDFSKPKKYVLPMFPYPSGSGLHVGHVRNYTIADVAARFYRKNGFNVLFVTGWDAFGLPSEQYSIQTNNHPSTFTYQNIERFKKQLIKLGLSYDWTKEINTSESTYYKWTQWIFTKIYQQGLAFYKRTPVLWCEQLSTVLANEEVKEVKGQIVSERGNFPVIKKEINQWNLKITDYSKRLSEQLSTLDWPSSIKNLQKNWIGFSSGITVKFAVDGSQDHKIDVFTTRVDTIYGVNSLVISYQKFSEISFLFTKEAINLIEKSKDLVQFVEDSQQELRALPTNIYCINPINGRRIPVWVANFVVPHFGTGALMISPFGGDLLKKIENNSFITKKEIEQNLRIDCLFSEKFKLPIYGIIELEQTGSHFHYIDAQLLINIFERKEAIKIISDFLLSTDNGFLSNFSHLRDWVFSRQRYWGEPFPVLHNNQQIRIVGEDDLPVELPHISDFKPSPAYYSPLQKATDWLSLKINGISWQRDVNVMPQWAGSSWYYLAFLIRKESNDLSGKFAYHDLNDQHFKKLIDHWLPVDLYIGGQEHANLHLLYARFWHHILNKIGITSKPEPFKKLLCQGMILGEDGEKMSKSRGNIINPDQCLELYGADALRLYQIFMAPCEQTTSFKINGVFAMRKWINRVFVLFTTNKDKFVENPSLDNSQINKAYFSRLLREISEHYELMKLNTIISRLMDFINKCYLSNQINIFYGKSFIQLLNPLAPHLAEELWEHLTSEKRTITFDSWPQFSQIPDDFLISKETFNLIVQIDGKTREIISIDKEQNTKNKILEIIKTNRRLSAFLKDLQITEIFFIAGKLINLKTV